MILICVIWGLFVWVWVSVVGFVVRRGFCWVLGASVGSVRIPRHKLGDPGTNWRCTSWSRAAFLVRGGGLEAQGRPARVRCCGLRLVCVFVGLGLLGCLSLCVFCTIDRKKKAVQQGFPGVGWAILAGTESPMANPWHCTPSLPLHTGLRLFAACAAYWCVVWFCLSGFGFG